MNHEWLRDGFTVSTDPARLDLPVIHGFLSTCYWAEGIPLEIVRRSIEHSLCFGVYADEGSRGVAAPSVPPRGIQVGFARVITDRATFGYLGDVFVLEPYRGRGLSKFMMECVNAHPELQGFRRWVLLTRDAHRLYEGFGYSAIAKPDRYMERWTPDVYEWRS